MNIRTIDWLALGAGCLAMGAISWLADRGSLSRLRDRLAVERLANPNRKAELERAEGLATSDRIAADMLGVTSAEITPAPESE